MMVYGEPQYRVGSGVFLNGFRERVRRSRADNVNDLRALAIQARQFESAMADAGHDTRSLTALADEAFAQTSKGKTADLSRLGAIEVPDVTLTIKIPKDDEQAAERIPGRDLSAGKWRELISTDWPPIFAPFERPKYLSDDGVLWKFAGLGAVYENGKTAVENAWDRMQALATEGFGPKPSETRRGFIAMPWIDGTRLTKADARDPAVLDFLSQYIIRFAGPPLDPEEMRAGQDRLAAMAITNTREALGDKWARVAEHKLQGGRDLHMFQSYGDGRLAPHEWVRDGDGRIFKVDSFGHDTDETLIGKQSIVWDFAGLILEWELSEAQNRGLMKALTLQGACITPDVLQFYQIAYAAFRMGLCNFCGARAIDPAEQTRLAGAEKSYCHKLLHVLNQE